MPTFSDSPSESVYPEDEPLGLSVTQIASPTLGGHCTPAEQLTRTASTLQEPHSPNTKARSAWLSEICSFCGVDLPVLTALRKSSFASKRSC